MNDLEKNAADKRELKTLARRWADRAVRFYAAGALQVAGFSTSAGALATLPEIASDESLTEAKRRVNTAIETVLYAREIPRSEDALVAAYAARAALVVASRPEPESRHLAELIGAIHAASLSSG